MSTPPYASRAKTARIERFVRYCARPPFALERLHAFDGTASLASPESRLLYRFPKPDVNGRTEILLTPLELLERIARFVPPGHPREAWVAFIATAMELPRFGGRVSS